MVTYSDFYNHKSFMKSVREGERIMAKEAAILAKMKPETSSIDIGDCVFSTGLANPTVAYGKVIDKWLNGKFLAFLVDWDFESRKKKHYTTVMRLKDIKKAN